MSLGFRSGQNIVTADDLCRRIHGHVNYGLPRVQIFGARFGTGQRSVLEEGIEEAGAAPCGSLL